MANINYLRDTTALGLSALIRTNTRPLGAIPPGPPVAPSARTGQARTGQASVGFWEIVVPISAALSGYHGYKRNNDDLGWGLGWGLLGGLFPIITPTVAFAQGFAKRER